MVSILDGEVHRTWNVTDQNDAQHKISLYHDTVTGVRCITVDYDEVPGSMGTSSILGASMTLPFQVAGMDGVVLILRNGLFGFRYQCKVDGRFLREANDAITETRPAHEYEVDVVGHVTASSSGGEPVAWYLLSSKRLSDGATTMVHRRYREFASLGDSLAASLKGHVASRLLPALPGRHLKLLIDHSDPTFLDRRQRNLARWIKAVVAIPHVVESAPLHTFLGLADGAREISVFVKTRSVGCTLQANENMNMPAIVTTLKEEMDGSGVRVGDVLTKINGYPTVGMSFKQAIETLRQAPRPLVVHFLQLVGVKNPATGEAKTSSDGSELEEKVKEAGASNQGSSLVDADLSADGLLTEPPQEKGSPNADGFYDAAL